MLKVIAESDLEDARKANWLIRPLGCREKRAPTWRDGRARIRPARHGGAVWRASQFHLYLATVVCMPVQDARRILVVSASYRVTNS